VPARERCPRSSRGAGGGSTGTGKTWNLPGTGSSAPGRPVPGQPAQVGLRQTAPLPRLGKGQLRRQVAEWPAARHGPHTVGEVAKDLGRSADAVGNGLTTLAGRVEATRITGKPLRYEASSATAAAAAAAITPKALAPPKAATAAPQPAASPAPPAAPKPAGPPASPAPPAAPKAPAPKAATGR
jgi:hypothetical protein